MRSSSLMVARGRTGAEARKHAVEAALAAWLTDNSLKKGRKRQLLRRSPLHYQAPPSLPYDQTEQLQEGFADPACLLQRGWEERVATVPGSKETNASPFSTGRIAPIGGRVVSLGPDDVKAGVFQAEFERIGGKFGREFDKAAEGELKSWTGWLDQNVDANESKSFVARDTDSSGESPVPYPFTQPRPRVDVSVDDTTMDDPQQSSFRPDESSQSLGGVGPNESSFSPPWQSSPDPKAPDGPKILAAGTPSTSQVDRASPKDDQGSDDYRSDASRDPARPGRPSYLRPAEPRPEDRTPAGASSNPFKNAGKKRGRTSDPDALEGLRPAPSDRPQGLPDSTPSLPPPTTTMGPPPLLPKPRIGTGVVVHTPAPGPLNLSRGSKASAQASAQAGASTEGAGPSRDAAQDANKAVKASGKSKTGGKR